ncbi:MAG TPA: hypothetical protein VMS21_02930, partial [Methylomirabilota bacterium]|nr:hypothetical protein [Methylomirabilota bacterium]
MLLLQDWIHKLEEGAGARYLRAGLAVLALAGMALLYDFVALRNFDSEEAMDLAQLARNLSEGRGFTTQFIRPLSLHLVQELDDAGDMRLEEPHPDLANAPLYPLLLAGAMKGLPFRYEINQEVRFQHHQPEILITAVNQCLFAVAILLVFLLARGLFDRSVAWMSALVMGGTELFWRFSTAGLPTMLMLDLFLGLVFCLVLLEKGAREETMSRARLIGLAVAIGVLAGLAGLTRYSLAWLILPVVLFVGLFGGRQRLTLGLVLVFAFLIVWMPWLMRNHQLSGHFFGTAGFVVDQETRLFPDDELERSLNPGEQLAQVDFYDYTRKAMISLAAAVREQVPVLGGSWVSALFLASLLLPFNRPGTSRLRVFILTCLALLLVVQSLGTTARFETTGGVTSENLLILVAPLVFMYGVSFFLVLIEQLRLPFPG